MPIRLEPTSGLTFSAAWREFLTKLYEAWNWVVSFPGLTTAIQRDDQGLEAVMPEHFVGRVRIMRYPVKSMESGETSCRPAALWGIGRGLFVTATQDGSPSAQREPRLLPALHARYEAFAAARDAQIHGRRANDLP